MKGDSSADNAAKNNWITFSAEFLSNLIVPGLGLCLKKRLITGLLTELLWASVLTVLFLSIVYLGFTPLKAVFIGVVVYIIMQAEFLLGSSVSDVSFNAYLTGLLFFIVLLNLLLRFGFKPNFGLALIRDRAEYPVLVPGDIVLYSKNTDKTALGTLVMVKGAGIKSVQRLVGTKGDLIEIKGPVLKVNGLKWRQKKLGFIQTPSMHPIIKLSAYKEVTPTTKDPHLVFFNELVAIAPFRRVVTDEQFLLADNRSADGVIDSRISDSLKIIGKPLVVLLSVKSDGFYLHRSGIIPQ